MKSRVKALSLPLSGMALAGVAGPHHQPVGRLSRKPSVVHLRPSFKRTGAAAGEEPEARAAVLGAWSGVRACSARERERERDGCITSVPASLAD